MDWVQIAKNIKPVGTRLRVWALDRFAEFSGDGRRLYGDHPAP
jgi:hypothetical protein